MKITDVKTYNLRYPLIEPFANSRGWTSTRTAVVVEIRTDAGITGWGEGVSVPSASAVEAHLIGQSPFETERIWEAMRGDIGALSGIDIALWDIMGKALDMPIYQLLGGAFRLKIPAYASGLFKKDKPDITQALMDEAKGYVDAGFPAVKMKIGFGETYDVKNVAAVRRAIGDDTLFAVDANCGYDVGTAIDVGQKLLDYDLFWYEEPITSDDVVGYREIRHALKVRIAGGEMLKGRWAFRNLLQERGLDIVQPDLSIAGGFTECRKIAAMASSGSAGSRYSRGKPGAFIKHIPMRILIEDHDERILPDLSASVDVRASNRPKGVLVPREALRSASTQGASFVYVHSDGQFHRREVRVQDVSDTEALIESGLQAGEEILLSGLPVSTEGYY